MRIVITGAVDLVVEIEAAATVKELKQKIMDLEGIPPCLQALNCCGRTPCDYEDIVHLGCNKLELKQLDSCEGGGCMQVFIQPFKFGVQKALGVHIYDTIRDVKRKIQAMPGFDVAVDDMHLVYNDLRMKNGKTLGHYNVGNRDKLTLILRQMMKIKVKIDDYSVTLDTDHVETVRSIKERIADEEDIPEDDIGLAFDGKGELNDRRRICDYGRKDTVNLTLFRKTALSQSRKRKWFSEHDYSAGSPALQPPMFEIFVKMLGPKTVTFVVHREMTVEEVKQQIMVKAEIPVEKQRLVFRGRQMKNEETLAFNKVEKESTLHLMLKLCGC